MDDLISRQAAIDCEYQVKIINDIEYVMLSEVQMKMRKLSSADRPQGEWIPCEERLPEADGFYLATFTLIGIPKFSNVESFKNGKWEYHNGYIIAWQPLPKPWSGKIKHKPKGADDE